MKEIILCKYGEIVLKGANKSSFESQLTKELRRRAWQYGAFTVRHAQSTVYIEPLDDEADIDGMYESARDVFGIVGVTRAAVAEKDMDDICRVAKEYLAEKLDGVPSFRVDAKRSDKSFPLSSPEIAAQVGGALLSCGKGAKVDLHNPALHIRVEVRESAAYLHAGQERGAGGLPRGSAGKAMLLLSGGIDSPVAGYMMAKRGLEMEAVHFESYPYTSERAKEKVFSLGDILCRYTSRLPIHVFSLTHIQEELVKKCDEDYFTLLLRHFMMRLAERCARERKCGALVTGESLGQVASQTLEALTVTEAAVSIPLFRPCIGMDKTEIIDVARKIGTFETSILPYEDCCTVFTPRHPRTRPALDKVLAELAKVDVDALLDEAWNSRETVTRSLYEEK